MEIGRSYDDFLTFIRKRDNLELDIEKIEDTLNKYFRKEFYLSKDLHNEYSKLKDVFLKSKKDEKYEKTYKFFFHLFEYILFKRLVSIQNKSVESIKFSPLLYQMH